MNLISFDLWSCWDGKPMQLLVSAYGLKQAIPRTCIFYLSSQQLVYCRNLITRLLNIFGHIDCPESQFMHDCIGTWLCVRLIGCALSPYKYNHIYIYIFIYIYTYTVYGYAVPWAWGAAFVDPVYRLRLTRASIPTRLRLKPGMRAVSC